jgi:transmembrane sensor
VLARDDEAAHRARAGGHRAEAGGSAMSESPELMRRIARAAATLDPDLTDRDVERVVQGAARRRRRRTGTRAALAATALGAAALAVVHFVPQPVPPAPKIASAMGAPLRLRDGSLATPLEPDSALSLVGESAERVELALGRGRARFEVVPSPIKRVFSVQAGDVTVTVLGTIFTVERVADRIGVTVERGTVRVDWKIGTRLLHKGESGWFPPLLVDSGGQTPAVAPAPRVAVVALAKKDKERDTETKRPPRAETSETAEGLLAQADSERVAGRAEQGAALLRRLLRDHAHDARAPLAAFTLGRLLLMELDRPREAAAAFAQVRALAPGGSFAEDALAREVEAWQRAGDADKVRLRAREYVKLYPSGRRVDSIRILGELE